MYVKLKLTCFVILQLRLVRLVGIMLVVYVREALMKNITDVSDKTVGTGLLGMMVSFIPNKHFSIAD